MFEGKIAVVTGGAHGIGKCIAEEFEKDGAEVCVIDKAPGNHYVGDISDQTVLEAFARHVIGKHGHVDYLINNALPLMSGIDECTYEAFQYALAVGVTAPFYLTKLFLPYFAKDAAIVNISSSRDRMSQPQTESYTAAKGGIAALTHALAVSLAGKVRVNSISPGWISTDERVYEGPDAFQQPAGRVGHPLDIANMVLYLCSDKAGFIISMKPPGGQRFIRLESLGAEYSEAALRSALESQHVHIPRIPRGDYTAIQIRRLIDIEAKLREGKGRGFQIWAERNNIDATAQSVIFLKEHQIGSIEELEEKLQALRSVRNNLHASIRQSKSRMDEINQLRQAIRDYRRTKDVYRQYRESGWSSRFYADHREEIEAHKKAQAVYSAHEGKMPTLTELTAEYDALRARQKREYAALSELKPRITTLNHIKYNFDILLRDTLPESHEHQRDEPTER